MTVVHIGADHAGFEMKEALKDFLHKEGYELTDHGAYRFDPDDDYPTFVLPVAKAVAGNTDALGVIIGGTGQGEAMAANRITGVRAAVYYGLAPEIVRISRDHNNANILSLGARFLTIDDARLALFDWLKTPFSNDERHARRLTSF